MGKIIDADKLLKQLDGRPQDASISVQVVRSMIELMQAVDAVPVIRCKDCKYKVETEDGEYNPEDIVCSYWESDGLMETDFCSQAKRKES